MPIKVVQRQAGAERSMTQGIARDARRTQNRFKHVDTPFGHMFGVIDTFIEGSTNYIGVTAQDLAQAIEDYMKDQAPWRDNTGNARSDLFGRAEKRVNGWRIVFGYTGETAWDRGEYYPFFLENGMAGRYAIVGPTREIYIDIVHARMNRMSP